MRLCKVVSSPKAGRQVGRPSHMQLVPCMQCAILKAGRVMAGGQGRVYYTEMLGEGLGGGGGEARHKKGS